MHVSGCFLYAARKPEKDKAHYPAIECLVEGCPALCPGFRRGQSTIGCPTALWNACHCALSFSGCHCDDVLYGRDFHSRHQGFIRSLLTKPMISRITPMEASDFFFMSSSSQEASSAARLKALMASPKRVSRIRETPRSYHSEADPGVISRFSVFIRTTFRDGLKDSTPDGASIQVLRIP